MIVELWPALERYLGRQRPFWRWLLGYWGHELGVDIGSARILVDTPHEVLVNKLCALLHRSELRDLVDIHAQIEKGGDLDRALVDAPKKDGGFSPLTLGWVLGAWPVADAARSAGLASMAEELVRFRDELLARVADP